jgi:hypothetical protein
MVDDHYGWDPDCLTHGSGLDIVILAMSKFIAPMARKRLLVAVFASVVLPAGCGLVAGVGSLGGCQAVAPRHLPSGAAAGQGVEDVAGGAKQFVWGSGPDRIEEIVGIDYSDGMGTETLATVEIGGRPGTLYRIGDSEVPGNGDSRLAISFESDGCSLTVFLPRDMKVDEATEYATRF